MALNKSIKKYDKFQYCNLNHQKQQRNFFQMASKHTNIKPLHISEEGKKDVQKLVAVENSLCDLTKQFINRNIDTIQNQTSKISKFAQGINSVLQRITSYKNECSKTTGDLEKEVFELDAKIKIYQRQFKNNNKESQYKKQIQNHQKTYLAEWQKRIEIASKINVEALTNLQIDDRKSKVNDIFKWVIVTIYGQSQAKYYWPNFKEQIFVRDQGLDFKQRMGKINASNAKEQQRVKTVDFLKSAKEIESCQELKKVLGEIESIRKIAQIFLNCYEIAKKIRDLQVAIQKSRQQSRERDEQAMRWKARAEALQDRIRSNKQYLGILSNIEQKLAGKSNNYAEKQSMAKEIIQKLKNNESVTHITIDVQNQSRDHCECAIF